ncbi:YihY/virulence factor BrkB family protein [Leeuwenhoekiella sp. A16]|uniref:YihY/virulence factor BrkB family protein n=1 Tax=unclassified Leeuwenhoekiella TaxID=2615029 RepID=UPI003A81382B|tara:strand:+ start:204373 stop:205299 length:927 start_codon:yes stop_codon:yes gene_type:complete
MSEEVEKELRHIPVIGKLVAWMKKIILPGFEGLSLYDFWELYSIGIIKGTFSTRASAIAFSFFMALFPFFLFILNLIPYVPINDFQEGFLNFIQNLLPAQTADFFEPVLLDIAANPRGGLLSLTLIFSIFLMANGVNAIFTGFEFSYHTSINRSIIRQYLVALGVSLILALLLLLTVIIVLYYQYTINELKSRGILNEDNLWISKLGSFVFFVVLIYCVVGTLYYFGTKEGRAYRFFSGGALMTTLLFLLTTYLFGIYINNFSNYNQLYGSIGALLIMMVYIWLNSNLLLLGFELNAALYQLKNKREP